MNVSSSSIERGGEREEGLRSSLDTHIVFRVDFNNFMARSIERRLMQGPKLPDVTGTTFFKVSDDERTSPVLLVRFFHLLFYSTHKCE